MGVTCSGKDTLLNQMVGRGYKRVLSYTTRPMRPLEENGVTYNFVTKEQFDTDFAEDRVLEHREYTVASGDVWYYYFPKKELDFTYNHVCIADVNGAKDLVKYYGEFNTEVVWVDTPVNECVERAIMRDGSSLAKIKEMCRRVASDIEEFLEFGQAGSVATYTHINSNASTEMTFNRLIKLYEYLERTV